MRHLVFVFLLCGAVCQAWAKDITTVYMYNAHEKKIRICTKIKGKSDAFPRYKCAEEKTGEKKDFYPDKGWIALEQLCFKDKRDAVKTKCLAWRFRDGRDPKYLCLDETSGKYAFFDPKKEKERKWKELLMDEPGCHAVEIDEDALLRDLTFEIVGEINENPDKSGKKEEKKK